MVKKLLFVLTLLLVSFPVLADRASEQGRYLPIYQYLDETGDGTGNTNMAIDGDAASTVFKFQPGDNKIALVFRIIVLIEDNGVFQAGGYGSISASALTNGLLIEVRNTSDNSVKRTYTNGHPIKTNVEWAQMSYDLKYQDFGGGSTNKYIVMRLSFFKAGQPLRIDQNTYLSVTVRDDLSSMVGQTIHVQGYYFN